MQSGSLSDNFTIFFIFSKFRITPRYMEDVDEMKINQVHSGNEQVEKFQIGEVKGNLIYIDIKPISFHTERRKVNAQEVED